jgi:hypothetical protein
MTNRSVLLKADGLLLNHYINRLPLTLEELERIAHDMDCFLTRIKKQQTLSAEPE